MSQIPSNVQQFDQSLANANQGIAIGSQNLVARQQAEVQAQRTRTQAMIAQQQAQLEQERLKQMDAMAKMERDTALQIEESRQQGFERKNTLEADIAREQIGSREQIAQQEIGLREQQIQVEQEMAETVRQDRLKLAKAEHEAILAATEGDSDESKRLRTAIDEAEIDLSSLTVQAKLQAQKRDGLAVQMQEAAEQQQMVAQRLYEGGNQAAGEAFTRMFEDSLSNMPGFWEGAFKRAGSGDPLYRPIATEIGEAIAGWFTDSNRSASHLMTIPQETVNAGVMGRMMVPHLSDQLIGRLKNSDVQGFQATLTDVVTSGVAAATALKDNQISPDEQPLVGTFEGNVVKLREFLNDQEINGVFDAISNVDEFISADGLKEIDGGLDRNERQARRDAFREMSRVGSLYNMLAGKPGGQLSDVRSQRRMQEVIPRMTAAVAMSSASEDEFFGYMRELGINETDAMRFVKTYTELKPIGEIETERNEIERTRSRLTSELAAEQERQTKDALRRGATVQADAISELLEQ